MDKTYADTVRLLLTVAPEVFANDIFAMKGGTAINLFLRDMPRLSVDIDVVYLPRERSRDEALRDVNQQLTAISESISKLGLHARTSDRFSVEFDLPILAPDELYGSKLVATLDRQHPRDLFDVWQLYESGGITDGMVECFVVYLAGHNRPSHEVIFCNEKNIANEFERAFVGMSEVECSLETLTEARARLQRELVVRLTGPQRQFLIGLARAEPDWSLLACRHAQELPALRWKLSNLEMFRKRRPEEFEAQARALESGLRRA